MRCIGRPRQLGCASDVVAPSKTPRAAADRVKTDRKDADLLVRLLLAGSLSAVAASTSASAHAAKPGNIAVVAASRELACFLWAAA